MWPQLLLWVQSLLASPSFTKQIAETGKDVSRRVEIEFSNSSVLKRAVRLRLMVSPVRNTATTLHAPCSAARWPFSTSSQFDGKRDQNRHGLPRKGGAFIYCFPETLDIVSGQFVSPWSSSNEGSKESWMTEPSPVACPDTKTKSFLGDRTCLEASVRDAFDRKLSG